VDSASGVHDQHKNPHNKMAVSIKKIWVALFCDDTPIAIYSLSGLTVLVLLSDGK
jgi:hypothetical protein